MLNCGDLFDVFIATYTHTRSMLLIRFANLNSQKVQPAPEEQDNMVGDLLGRLMLHCGLDGCAVSSLITRILGTICPLDPCSRFVIS